MCREEEGSCLDAREIASRFQLWVGLLANPLEFALKRWN